MTLFLLHKLLILILFVAENCDKSVRLNTVEDIKENFNLMSKYNQDKYNAGTYTRITY